MKPYRGNAIAVGVLLLACTITSLVSVFGDTTVNTVLNVPILLQELVLAVWVILTGVNSPQLDADHEPTGRATPVTVRLHGLEGQST